MNGERKIAIFALLVPVVVLCAHLLIGSKETSLALWGLQGSLPYYASSFLWVLGLVFVSGIRFNPFVVAVIVGTAYVAFRGVELNSSQYPPTWDGEFIYETLPMMMYNPTKEWVYGAFSGFGQIVQLLFVAGLSHFLAGRLRWTTSQNTAAVTVVTLGIAGLMSGIAQGADAQQWGIQHLAYTGGTHPIQVEPEEGQFTEAFVRYPDRMGFYVGCLLNKAPHSTQNQTMLRLANGYPFLGARAVLSARFDAGDQWKLEEFGYSQGGYYGFLPPQVLAMMMSHETVEITDTLSDFTVTFSLDGAIDGVKPRLPQPASGNS